MELPKDIKTLTGIRGFAAFWVVLYHLHFHPFFLASFTPGKFLTHGFWGVDVFFVLSGFVLSHVYENKFSGRVTGKTYGHYLGLRLARLYPLHIVTFVAAFVTLVLSNTVGNRAKTSSSFGFYDGIMHLMLLHAWGTTEHLSWNTVSWSISAEWFAYLFLLAPFVRLFREMSLKVLCAMLAIVWLMFTLVYLPLQSERSFADVTCLGIVRIVPEFLGGYVAYRIVKTLYRKAYLFDIGCFAGMVGIAAITYQDTLQIFLLPAVMLLMIGISAEGTCTSVLFGNRISVFFGEISYSIYMCHALLLWPVDVMFKRLNLPQIPWMGTAFLSAYLVTVILSSFLLYTLVERPSRDWARGTLDKLCRGDLNTKQQPSLVALDPRNLRQEMEEI